MSTLLFGCVQYENGKPVETHEVSTKEEGSSLKEALKEFKQGKVADVTDARKENDHISVMIDFDDNVGARTQAGGTISNTDSFIKELEDKPKTVTVSARYKGTKVLQFTQETKSGKVEIESAHKDIEEYLKNAGYTK